MPTPEQLQKMYQWYLNMQSAATIELATDQAIRGRFINLNEELSDSSVNPNTKEQVTSAGGGDTVPQVFQGFKTTADGILIPYYTP